LYFCHNNPSIIASAIQNVGKLRLEGKDYIVKDGDVMFFRTGA